MVSKPTGSAPAVLPSRVALCAFEGWNDAGGAASAALEHLARSWSAHEVGRLDPEEFHDFQVNRPLVTSTPEGRRALEWPTTSFSTARAGDGTELVLVRGVEPSMRWRTFCTQVLDRVQALGARSVLCIGALLADVPHTRAIPVSATSSDRRLRERMELEPNEYEGPTGIVGVLEQFAVDREMSAVSMWAAVPHYVAHPPSPKATLAILRRVEDLIGVTIPLGDLREEARAWQHGVDELASEDTEIAEYVQQLEEAKDTADSPEATGEAIAREFERYLRRRDERPDKGDKG